MDTATCLTEGRRYYATLLALLGNRIISMDTLITPVFLRCMVTNCWKASKGRQYTPVSLRNQKSYVLAVRSQGFRRVSVISGVRSLGLYLVVNCCVSSQQL
jgi:hypothetical protein